MCIRDRFQHVTANTWFKVKGSEVKVTAYVRANTDSLQMCLVRYLFIPRECVEHLPITRMRIAHSGRIGSTWRLQGALRKTSENNIFKPNKPEKRRTSGAKSESPSRCNAFAIARFLVFLQRTDIAARRRSGAPVSYTHLTLPTIYSV